VKALVVMSFLMLALLVTGCRTSFLGQNVWIRPAMSFASRSVDVGDTNQVVLPEYEPRGDSMFVVVRVYPKDKNDANKLTGANVRKWPELIRKKISESPKE
jgi:hypothetical protein